MLWPARPRLDCRARIQFWGLLNVSLSSAELMVMIKHYKQTDAPYQKLVVRIKHYKQKNRQTQPFKKWW